jgi:DNA polymerase-3 subunit alpha
LTALARAVDLAAERGTHIDLAAIPLDDARTYAMLGHGDTTGVFQLESTGMRDVVRRLKADRFEDIIAVVALYRPGPMENIPSYIARKHGTEPIDYLHPSLEGILKETFGIMIYQEQVMQIAQVLSGYTLGSADLLRRAMGKKIKSEMEAQRRHFVEGAIARDVPEGRAGLIFDQVNKFAEYGFNKSHAAAYALVAYQTAWMKANYPVEFLAASMTLDLGNTDKLNLFRQEVVRLGITLLPPDINRSRAGFTVEQQVDGSLAIRYALAAVKRVGATAIDSVVIERERGGPFASLAELAARLDARQLNKAQVENLAAAGAFDLLNANRRQCFEAAETIVHSAAAAAAERESGQSSLFGENSGLGSAALKLPEVADWPAMERLSHEFEAIGFYLSAHPLDTYGASLRRLEAVRHGDLGTWLRERATNRARLAGIVIDMRLKTSAKGNRFAVVQLSDTSGTYEVMVFSDTLAAVRDQLEPGRLVLLTVEVRREDEGLRLMAQKVEGLEAAAARAAGGLRVQVAGPEAVERLRQVLAAEPAGRGRVKLVLDLDSAEADVALPGAWALSAATRAAIAGLPGVTDVQEV